MRTGPKTFPSKNGLCQLYSDRIEINVNGAFGKLLRWLYGKGFKSMSVIYGLLFVGFIAATAIAFLIDNYFLAFFFVVFSLVSLYALWINRNVSIAPVIQRREIEKVVYHEAVQGVSRASFDVYFRPEKRLLKRKIFLPSLMQNGAEIANSAYWMMRDEGLVE